MLRIYTISAVLGLAIAGSVFVFQNSPLAQKESGLTQNKPGNLNSLVTGKPFVESLTTKTSGGRENLEENLTESFTRGVGRIIYENNPSGPQDFYGESVLNAPNPEEIAENLLAEAAQKFNPEMLRPKIDDSDLRIVNDVSGEGSVKYLNNFQRIVFDAAKKIPRDIYQERELDVKDFELLTDIYNEAIKKIYELEVPRSLLNIHKKQLELLGAKKNIFERLSRYEEDPIMAILTAQELEKIDSEFLALSKEIPN